MGKQRRVKENVYGNWIGYVGRTKTQNFGPRYLVAQHWLETGELENSPFPKETLQKLVAIKFEKEAAIQESIKRSDKNMSRKLEEVFIDLIYEAAKDRFLGLIKEHDKEIKEIVEELITPDFVRSQIMDMVIYDDQLKDFLRELATEAISNNLPELLKDKRP